MIFLYIKSSQPTFILSRRRLGDVNVVDTWASCLAECLDASMSCLDTLALTVNVVYCMRVTITRTFTSPPALTLLGASIT